MCKCGFINVSLYKRNINMSSNTNININTRFIYYVYMHICEHITMYELSHLHFFAFVYVHTFICVRPRTQLSCVYMCISVMYHCMYQAVPFLRKLLAFVGSFPFELGWANKASMTCFYTHIYTYMSTHPHLHRLTSTQPASGPNQIGFQWLLNY